MTDLPISEIPFDARTLAYCHQNGIQTLALLAETALSQRKGFGHATGQRAEDVVALIESRTGPLPLSRSGGVALWNAPSDGALDPRQRESRGARLAEGFSLADHMSKLPEPPTRFDVIDSMPDVIDQGPDPICVGCSVATISGHFNPVKRNKSPEYSFLLAQEEGNCRHIAGAYTSDGLAALYQVGSVPTGRYTRTDMREGRPLDPLRPFAAQARIGGFTQIAGLDIDQSYLPKLMFGLLSGTVNHALQPMPLAISLRLHDGFALPSVVRNGMVSLPPPGAPRRKSGHAMVAVGYIRASDPMNPYNDDRVFVQNSWGKEHSYAPAFGLPPGHLLVPAAYFADPDLCWGCYAALPNAS